ncbi:MAG: sulfite exporter TauE/SafE family protein [Candidatus Nanopelagicales bacterium]
MALTAGAMRGATLVRDLAIGLVAGVLSGLFGVGGGIVVVPILVLLVHVPQKRAQATSLVMIALAALAGSITYARDESVAWIPAVAIVIGGLSGSWIGTTWIHKVADRGLQIAFAALLILAAVKLAWPSGGDGVSSLPAITPIVLVGYVACGLAMGLMSSMMGVGGGIVLIPLLVTFFGFSQHDAAGTSLLVMIPIALLSAFRLARTGLTDWAMGLRMGAGAIVGAVTGASLALALNADVVQTAFALLLAAVAAQMLWTAWRHRPEPEMLT